MAQYVEEREVGVDAAEKLLGCFFGLTAGFITMTSSIFTGESRTPVSRLG